MVTGVVDVGVGVGLKSRGVEQPSGQGATGRELAGRDDDEIVTVTEESELIAPLSVGRCRAIGRVDAGVLAGLVEVHDDPSGCPQIRGGLVGAVTVEVSEDEVAEVIRRDLDDHVVGAQELRCRQGGRVDGGPVGVVIPSQVVGSREREGDLLALTWLAVKVKGIVRHKLEGSHLRERRWTVGRHCRSNG